MTEKVFVQAPGRYENIPVRLLRPSPRNLRLVNPDGSMHMEGSPSTHTEMCSTLSLARSIGQSGYQLSEPMIVIRDEDENGNICYTVEDGGLRLSALLMLLDDKQEELKNLPYRPETVPCVVYEKTEIDTVRLFLGYRHTIGTLRWQGTAFFPEYVRMASEQLVTADPSLGNPDRYGALLDKVATVVGFKPEAIARHLFFHELCRRGFSDSDDVFFGSVVVTPAIIQSSLFRQLFDNDIVLSYIGADLSRPGTGSVDTDRVRKVADWVYDLKDRSAPLTPAEIHANIDKLAGTLSDPEGLRKLELGFGLKEAFWVTKAYHLRVQALGHELVCI